MSLNCGARKKITIKPASSKISKFKRDEKKNTTSRKRKKITRRRAEFYVLTFLNFV